MSLQHAAPIVTRVAAAHLAALGLAVALCLPAVAVADTYDHVIDGVVSAPLHPDRFELLLEDAVGHAPAGTTRVRVMGYDAAGRLHDLETLLPPPLPPPAKEGEGAVGDEDGDDPASAERSTSPVDLPGPTAGFLSGKAVYLSQCHGYIYFDSLNQFSTQRGNVFDTVEDFHNPEGANAYLTAYLENAGAAVFTARERDMTPEMVIADNDDPGSGYGETGSGWEFGGEGFAEDGPWLIGDQPFDAGTTRRFPADGGGRATWNPNVPADGEWAIYVSWDSDSENATDAHYRITHPGGVIDRTFDQTAHGSTWQYVERLWLPAGPNGLTVELIGDSTTPNRWLSADAVRVGGGFGDVLRVGDLSGRARWEEGANTYVQWNGGPRSLYDPSYDGIGSDVRTRSRWAAWEQPAGEDAVYLSWHSNAAGGTGTVTLTYNGSSGQATEGSDEFAELLQEELVDSIRARWDSNWNDRGTYGGGFGELNPVSNPDMPAALVELGFHDTAWDVAFLKEPQFRRDASRAMTRGVIRYFAERDGVTPLYAPEPPVALRVLHDPSAGGTGRLIASWDAGPAGFPDGDAATDYVVFTSADGRSWDNGVVVGSGTELELSTARGELVFVRVAARNVGGASFPSAIAAARRSPDGTAPILLVDAYDRLQASQLPWESIGGALGDVRRMVLRRMNSYDGLLPWAWALDALGWPFESTADEALPDLTLGDWPLLVWVAGEESTTDETFSAAQQVDVRAFVDGGGALIASGSEILWDLDAAGDLDDLAFADEVLGALMAADDAGTSVLDGTGLLAGLQLDFDPGGDAWFDVDYPDTLDTLGVPVALYPGGAVGGAITGSVALFGVPLEAVVDEADRDEAIARLVQELLPNYVPPVDTGDDDDDDDDVVGDDDDDDDVGDDDDTAGDDDDTVGDDDDDSVNDDDDTASLDAAPYFAADRYALIDVDDDGGKGCSACGSSMAGGGTAGAAAPVNDPAGAWLLLVLSLACTWAGRAGPSRRRASGSGS